jgi:hypothetical protein
MRTSSNTFALERRYCLPFDFPDVFKHDHVALAGVCIAFRLAGTSVRVALSAVREILGAEPPAFTCLAFWARALTDQLPISHVIIFVIFHNKGFSNTGHLSLRFLKPNAFGNRSAPQHDRVQVVHELHGSSTREDKDKLEGSLQGAATSHPKEPFINTWVLGLGSAHGREI